jgi:hypothetical protein
MPTEICFLNDVLSFVVVAQHAICEAQQSRPQLDDVLGRARTAM